MAKITNLAKRIEKQLPLQLVEFMESSGLVAANLGWHLYLVGGTVRDLLLGQPNYDLDMVVEGDAVDLGNRLAKNTGAKIIVHSRFGTVKLLWQNWTIDIATARTETYASPGVLPVPKPGLLADDLFRRDFTINAMAVELFSGRWGQLIDLYGGQDDLKNKTIRILHDNSFNDDATRIWRAIRYEQRLDFAIEPDTLRLLKRAVSQLDTISGDRIRHEVELVLKEAIPEKALSRADELRVLAKLHPGLKGTDWLTEKFQEARQLNQTRSTTAALYLALFTYPLTGGETENLISYLRLPKPLAQTIRDSGGLKTSLKLLAKPNLRPSRIYELLHVYSATAITANFLATDSPTIQQHIQLFLTKLRYVKSATTGADLKKMGIPPGPNIKEILQKLLEARLDGKVTSRREEEELVREWSVSIP